MLSGDPELREVPFDDPALADLLARYFSELAEVVPGFVVPPPDRRALNLVVWHAGKPVACAALRRLDPSTVEVKRMFVLPEARGAGHARRLLAALEDRARTENAARIVLDTAAPLDRALALYQRSGYVAIAPYNDNPHAAHWFEKRLRVSDVGP